MERMQNALIEGFKKLNHNDKKLVLAFVRQIVKDRTPADKERLYKPVTK